jgi:transposase
VTDTEFYAALLRLRYPWSVREVKLNLAADRVDVWVQEDPTAKWVCPECRKTAPLYDHAEERVWQHLDTCDCQTFLHAHLPRVKCSEHGVRQVMTAWALASPGSQFTLRLECRVIDTLKECDVTGTTRLTSFSWDEA